jgi:copper transport protein
MTARSPSTRGAVSRRRRPTCTSSSFLRPAELRLAFVAAILLALALPAGAAAHARLVGSKPADGAVLATAPKDVKLLYDDEIRPAGGDRVVDARGRSVLAGPARRLSGNDRALVLPLRPGLTRGSYTVRWRVVSNDGHLITGVLAFAVGAGSPRPVPTLSASGGTSFSAIGLRFLFLAGVLLGGGAALTGRILLEPGRRRVETIVVAGGLVLVAGGGFGLLAIEPAADATRFGRVTATAAIAALVGLAAALAAIVLPPLAVVVSLVGALELVMPTLAGHALDPRHLRWLIALADFVHVAAAAVWIGGLVLLVVGGGRRARERFPSIALAALAVLGAAAIPRVIAAFPSLASVVHTSYGRAVLVKTGLLAAVLMLAWLNRRRIAREGLTAELVLLAGLVVAVAVLTDLRPPPRASAAPPPAAGRPGPPPADALVLAGEDDDVAVGFAASPRGKRVAVRVTALGEDGNGIDGLRVRVAGGETTPCGPGCYARTIPLPAPPRNVDVRLEGTGVEPATVRFTLPRRWPAPAATALVTRADRVFRGLRSLVIHEHLASSSKNAITTTYLVAAPNRLAYSIVGGPKAVVIGSTRWDRLPGGRWERSQTEPLRQPEPFWASDPRTNARYLGTGSVGGRRVELASFYDPHLPAWFVLSVDPETGRLLALHMTAQAHFMQHRYSDFDKPLRIVPPTSG